MWSKLFKMAIQRLHWQNFCWAGKFFGEIFASNRCNLQLVGGGGIIARSWWDRYRSKDIMSFIFKWDAKSVKQSNGLQAGENMAASFDLCSRPHELLFYVADLDPGKMCFFFILGRKLLKPSIDLCQFLSLSLSESFKPQYNNYNLYQVLPRCVWMICFHRCLFSFFSFEPATIILMFWQLFLFPVCVLFLFWDWDVVWPLGEVRWVGEDSQS